MVETLEALRVATAFSTDLGSPVGTGIQECAHDAVSASHEQHATLAEVAKTVVAEIGDLRFVANVEPAAVKDAALLLCEEVFVEEGPTLDAEQAGLVIFDDERMVGHDVAFLWPLGRVQ